MTGGNTRNVSNRLTVDFTGSSSAPSAVMNAAIACSTGKLQSQSCKMPSMLPGSLSTPDLAPLDFAKWG
jgi:hypothetical protein